MKQLTATKILAQRSAVPAVFSRVTAAAGKRKALVSREDKERLMRIAKRPRKGPFNSVMDPAECAAGSGAVELSAAVKQSGAYDAWAAEPMEEEVKDGLETVQKKKAKVRCLSCCVVDYELTFCRRRLRRGRGTLSPCLRSPSRTRERRTTLPSMRIRSF